MIYQYLWSAYALVFQDKTLHYSILGDYILAGKRASNLSDRPKEYYFYKSRFFQTLSTVLSSGQISESHLFAVFFAILSSWNEPETDFTALRAHQRGFIQIFNILISRETRDSILEGALFGPSTHTYYPIFGEYRVTGKTKKQHLVSITKFIN